MFKTVTAYLLGIFILSGCATTIKTNNLSIGMTKQEVIAVMGEPISTSAISGLEVFRYHLQTAEQIIWKGGHNEYFVRFVNGKVESYGKMGDFNSTKVPETKSTIDLNVNK
ncbi:MAG TPA: outer membrane protein assembly factor BamE [Phycisphaerales bacterium]|nr:smpA / OmlA family protein [bacterium BMS3Abin11]HDZ68847.1 outer membrane protein assembly factor BamE [Phycisphaerales bacterium]